MKKAFAFWLLIVAVACNNEQDAGPADTDTFMKLIGGPNTDIASVAYETFDGYIVLGTTEIENDDGSSDFRIRLVKTDKNGNISWDRQFPETADDGLNYEGNSLIITEDGYLIVGDRIYANEKTGLLLLHINPLGNETMSNTITITESEDTLSIHGVDLTINANDELKVTGKIDTGLENLYVGTVSLNDLSVIPSCSFRYSSAGTNTSLIKSVNIEENGDIVFGAAVRNNSRLIRVPECQNSQITGPLIQTEDTKTYTCNQIVKSATGYAMIGTTDENNNKDIFLARVNQYGDGALITVYTNIDGVTLNNDEEGLTIAPTSDGGFIFGGSTLSSTRGELDIIIVKSDFLGNVQWSKRFGDQNEESVKFITQTSDGGYLILGDIEFGGIDTMTLIKTDEQGNVN